MTMKSFCFALQMNTIIPSVFFDKIESHDMKELKNRIDAAVTMDDAQAIINDYA